MLAGLEGIWEGFCEGFGAWGGFCAGCGTGFGFGLVCGCETTFGWVWGGLYEEEFPEFLFDSIAFLFKSSTLFL